MKASCQPGRWPTAPGSASARSGSLSTYATRAPGAGRLGHLVDVAGTRDAGADVEELADAGLVDQDPHGPPHERPLRAPGPGSTGPAGRWPRPMARSAGSAVVEELAEQLGGL